MGKPVIVMTELPISSCVPTSGAQEDCWFGVERNAVGLQSHWSDLNRRPLDYESRALPLSYSGGTSDALARIRTATPFGTTPSR